MLVSDHPHLFEAGGENYHTDFGAWEYLRGHEDDPWRTRPDPSAVGAPAAPGASDGLARRTTISRTWFRDEADFPGPDDDGGCRVARPGAQRERRPEERALLFVDEFDPHEPFDTPEPMGEAVRRRLGGRAHHLAAVHGWRRRGARRHRRGLTEREGSMCEPSTAPSSR